MEEVEQGWRCRRVSRRKAEVRQWSPRCWPGGPRREGHPPQLGTRSSPAAARIGTGCGCGYDGMEGCC